MHLPWLLMSYKSLGCVLSHHRVSPKSRPIGEQHVQLQNQFRASAVVLHTQLKTKSPFPPALYVSHSQKFADAPAQCVL